jgi:hypothetical protein
LVNTSFVSGEGTSGEYVAELSGVKGETLLTYRFDVHRASESASLFFLEVIPWNRNAKKIVIRGKRGIIATREVSDHEPWVKIISPKVGDEWGRNATITWEAGDTDKDQLTFSVFLNVGNDGVWIPLATNLQRMSLIIDTSLVPGSRSARVLVRVPMEFTPRRRNLRGSWWPRKSRS